MPIAIVNVLDEDQDWFKASSPVATSFCETFFPSRESIIVVEDTPLDPRFSDHPLVVGPPHIRFYAAARLSVDENTNGTLCAYDVQPRVLSTRQWDNLRTPAEAVIARLRARQSAAQGLVQKARREIAVRRSWILFGDASANGLLDRSKSSFLDPEPMSTHNETLTISYMGRDPMYIAARCGRSWSKIASTLALRLSSLPRRSAFRHARRGVARRSKPSRVRV